MLEAEGQVHISAGANYTVAGALTDTTDGGEATHTLTVDEMPQHKHNLQVHTSSGSSQSVSGLSYVATGYANTSFCNYTGESKAHNNMQPYIIVNRWHRTA